MVRDPNEAADVVRLSPSNWITLGVFFTAQTLVLLATGIGMYVRLAVLEYQVNIQSEAIKAIQLDMKAIEIAKKTGT